MAAISPEPSELEVMREEDGSWHPCHVSLSKASDGIIVYFENYDEEDIISNRKDALRRLRFRSIPLKDGECFHIKEGESVLAMHKLQSRSLFFDAVIEKLYRVKHSNRVFCRCTFEVKWLNCELNEKCVPISSNSIMRLSKKNIVSHPVVDAFLTTSSPTDGVEVPPFLSLLEESNFDVDLHGLLEKQIEEISKLADKSKECNDNLLLGDKKGGLALTKAVVTLHISLGNSQNDLTRSTRSRKKQEAELKIKKHLEDKPFLSPLAARAALASLMHEVPQKPENLNSHVNDPKKHIKEQTFDVACILVKYDASVKDNMLFASNPFQDSKNDSLVEARSSASNRTASMKKSQSRSTTVNHVKNSVRERKLNGLASTARITRSVVQKEMLDSTAEDSEGKLSIPTIIEHTRSLVTDGKLNGHAIMTRRTRSALQKETPYSTVEMMKSSEEPEGKLSSPAIIEQMENSVADGKLNGHAITPRITRSAVQKDVLHSAAEVTKSSKEPEGKLSNPIIIDQMENSVTDGKLNGRAITPRLTRSAVQKEILHSTAEVVNEKHSSPMNSRLTCSTKKNKMSNPSIVHVEDLVTPEKDENKMKKFVSSPVDSDTVSPLDKKKRTRASSDSTTTEKGQGEILQNCEGFPAVKKRAMSSKKPESRFSPRLRFLPRTRSLNKS